ncbi:MAG TPA: ABC transporter permease [Gemmatimonadaceae bacterium]|nr:ABC transporter permease [Gemmatimonadaceae bacterium]
METLRQDLRYALRTLARSRAFAASAVLCLALGIGLNTAVFSLVNAILLRPFDFRDPDRVVAVYAAHPARGIHKMDASAADYWEWKEGARSLADLAALSGHSFALAGDGAAERVEGMYTTPNLFAMLGYAPALGRLPAAGEGREGSAPLVLLSHALWERRLGSDPGIVGRAVLVDGVPHTVIGVMPRGVQFPETAELWVPSIPDRTEPRSSSYLWVLGRLAPGRTVADAQREVADISARAAAAHPETNRGWTAEVMTFRDDMVDGQLRTLLGLMLAAVGFVLLIACANVANLLLARGAVRSRELALRAALGAARRRLVRQMLTESVVVAVVGGALGVLISVWWLDAILATIPERLPYWLRVELDGRVLAYTALLSVGTGLLFGMLPALRTSRPDLQTMLRSGGRGETGNAGRLRGALVAGEIALAVMLLTAATLMTRGFLAVTRADAGFDTRGMLTMRTFLAGPRYDSVKARAAYLNEAVRRLEAVPAVTRAAATTAIPTDDGGPLARLVVDGRPAEPGSELLVSCFASTPGLFDVLGTPLLEGRSFTAQEAADPAAAVVVLNRRLARQLWPEGSAVGHRIRLPGVTDSTWLTVIGVARDLQYEEFGEETPQSRLQIHLPYARMPHRTMAILVRASREPAAVVGPVREAMRTLDTTLPTFDIRTMDEVRAYTMWPSRVFSQTFNSFALVALVLAALGIYGVMSYHVAQRVRSIGVRMALGASPGAVRREVLRHGAGLALAGALAGVLGALAVGRAMAGVMYGVGGTDPLTLLGVPLVLGAVALLACYLPARRATRIDPIQALRSE